MKTRLCLVLMFAGWVATGCQSMRVQTHYDQQVAFADFHTFCWVPAPAWLHNDPRLHMDLVEPIVRHDIETQLQARGFRLVDCAAADFQVTFSAAIHESSSESPDADTSGVSVYEYTPGEGGEWFTATSGMDIKAQRVSSLVILIQEPRTTRVLWRGKASANMPAPTSDAQRQQRVQTAVRLILEKFPPPVSK